MVKKSERIDWIYVTMAVIFLCVFAIAGIVRARKFFRQPSPAYR